MKNIMFDVNKLNKSDRKVYDAMSDSEKKSFEVTWILIEEQKMKLIQKKNASKERLAREKKTLAEKERKERNHRLIERGAILEANIKNPLDFSNEEIKEIVEKTFQSDYMRKYIEKVRSRHGFSSTSVPDDSLEMTSDFL